MYYYHTLGLVIESEIVIKQLKQIDSSLHQSNVKITLGEIPDHHLLQTRRSNTIITSDQFILEVFDIVRYQVSKDQILIYPLQKQIDWVTIKLVLIDSCLPILAYYQQLLPFSCSGFSDNKDNCYLLMGEAGIGKSWITAKMMENGFEFFSDNFTTVYHNNHKVYAKASLSSIELWNSTFKLNSQLFSNKKTVRAGIGKHWYQINNFCNTPKLIRKIFLLYKDIQIPYSTSTIPAKIDALSPYIKFSSLIEQLNYHRYALGLIFHLASQVEIIPIQVTSSINNIVKNLSDECTF